MTSWAVISRPSWNSMPGRRRIVQTVAVLLGVISSAIWSCGCPWGVMMTRESKRHCAYAFSGRLSGERGLSVSDSDPPVMPTESVPPRRGELALLPVALEVEDAVEDDDDDPQAPRKPAVPSAREATAACLSASLCVL